MVPALFNINDPIMFGVPVVMNPTLAVPFVLSPLVCALSAWVAFHFGMVTRPHLDILWTLPAPIGAFGSTGDPRALVLLALNFGMAYLIYAPFVRTYDRRMLQQEARPHAAAETPAPVSTADEAQAATVAAVSQPAHADDPATVAQVVARPQRLPPKRAWIPPR